MKSVEYLRSNFRPIQSLDNRDVFKSAVRDAWLPDLTDSLGNPYGTEASKGRAGPHTPLDTVHPCYSPIQVNFILSNAEERNIIAFVFRVKFNSRIGALHIVALQ